MGSEDVGPHAAAFRRPRGHGGGDEGAQVKMQVIDEEADEAQPGVNTAPRPAVQDTLL